ncbi:MAG: hypothetical protein DHS20C01_33060 [marine bacterium B5-7]|nr:MAG: hypothetical protein DHS20C01_33060 [marine bacterium B5-7]
MITIHKDADNHKALVTLTIGREYNLYWRRYCQRFWLAYAKRHGYDIVCIDKPIDESRLGRSRPVHWQKHLLLSTGLATRYDRLVIIDADIAINPDAPCVVNQTPIDKIGVVDEYATPTPELHGLAQDRLYDNWSSRNFDYIRDDSAHAFYRNAGYQKCFDRVVQAGMMVVSTRHHRDVLESIYYKSAPNDDERGNREMRITSHSLLSSSRIHWLDGRFNMVWSLYRAAYCPDLIDGASSEAMVNNLRQAISEVYFLHFAGEFRHIPLLDQVAPEAGTSPWMKPATIQSFQQPLNTPVVLIVFNRPESTTRVFEAIRNAKPKQLLVIADGPRVEHPEDVERCAAARAVIDGIDWDCEVQTCFSNTNLGTRKRVVSGLDWVFSIVDEAIILEDDCVPHSTFFSFCEDMLNRYRDDSSVLTISGNNFQFRPQPDDDSYTFSRYPLIWGWATWRRSWMRYDESLEKWPELRNSDWLKTIFGNTDSIRYWSYLFENTYNGFDTWDFQLCFASFLSGALNIHPNVNLVSNIGFGKDATHTWDKGDPFAAIPALAMQFPLSHPPTVTRDSEADDFIEQVLFGGIMRSLLRGLGQRIRRRHQRDVVITQ